MGVHKQPPYHRPSDLQSTYLTMSFDQLSSLESQPTTMQRQDDPQYSDDPEFQRLSQELMTKLFTLTGNISRLSNEVALLRTRRDTERVRERVHDLLEESKDTFKEVGEGVKTIHMGRCQPVSKIHTTEACPRVPEQPLGVPVCTATSAGEATILSNSGADRIRRRVITWS